MQPFNFPEEQRFFLDILNQVFEIEKKLERIEESNSISRNLNKLKGMFETEIFRQGTGLVYENPLGESYDETRFDCEASIAGTSTENLAITEVIKPIIRLKRQDGISQIVQKAVVIVQSKND